VYLELSLFSYIIDRIFGEFKYIKHPVMFMGDFIKYFENKFYKDDVFRGGILTISLLSIVFLMVGTLVYFIDNTFILAIIGSTTIASKMLYASIKDIIENPSNIKYLVSRDTKDLSSSDINKASIETYAENLSDGVIAPLFYMLLFGLLGAFIYKAINTLDSMVGYRKTKYENFGKVSAVLDDISNYIPSRITALIIAILSFSYNAMINIKNYGHLHDSPNAGYPISALAGVCDISLGGDTIYEGKLKEKAYFGNGSKNITTEHIKKALRFQVRLDVFVIVVLSIAILF